MNINEIENIQYIKVHPEIYDYLDDEQNFENLDDFNWWKNWLIQ